MDPVLFENFLTEDGDLLRAKFQAFKFPETNFVLFKGIVNVCLDRCNGVRKQHIAHTDETTVKVSTKLQMTCSDILKRPKKIGSSSTYKLTLLSHVKKRVED